MESARSASENLDASFNSLSRDHFDDYFGKVDLIARFQLPLSGSRTRGTAMRPMVIPLSTPSLGITVTTTTLDATNNVYLSTPSLGITWVIIIPFNFISSKLSTPSLGITIIEDRHIRHRSCRSSFNSLSRDHRALFRDFPALRGFPPRRPFAHLYFPATI